MGVLPFKPDLVGGVSLAGTIRWTDMSLRLAA